MERTGHSVILTRSPDETEAVGAALASRLGGGVCVALVGGLGAGKTVFVRGACRGLDVAEDILSPTFILYEAFDGRLPVVHVDLYRLEHESEIESLGVFDLLGGDTVVLVEWGDRSDTLMDNVDIAVGIDDSDLGHPRRRRIDFAYTPDLAAVFGDIESWLS
jgi:tRNA threonylcarbamoyladenosine biosynthesis protein TsaE